MEKLLQDGLLGIITGILTTVILYITKVLWDTKIAPFIRETRYHGVKIDGHWYGFGEELEKKRRTEIKLFLVQNADQLGGQFVLKHESPENSFEITFNVRGYIWEGYLVINMKPIDRRKTSFSTAMLKIAGGGVGLVGTICFRDVTNDDVTAERMFLARKEEN